MKTRMRGALFILLLTFVFSSYAQPKIVQGLQEIADEYRAVGLTVAVIKDNKLIFDQALGYKDLEAKEPLQTSDLFRIASISKSFTATAIMQLVEQKKISLDDDFSTLIGFPVRNPNFPDAVITLRMVLSHTSSINDKNGYFNLDVINPAKNEAWKDSYNKYTPGKGYEYCNLNFNMLGAVLELLTQQRFDLYIKQQILKPLGLNAGYCVDSLDARRFANLYNYNADTKVFVHEPAAYAPRSAEIQQYQLGQSTPLFSPTGGMKISTLDLATYMQMHMNYGSYAKGRILSDESAKIMQSKLSEEEGYGLALRESNILIPGEQLVGHTGSAYGVYSIMFFNPVEKYGFVVITNGCVPEYEADFVALSRKTINYLYQALIKTK